MSLDTFLLIVVILACCIVGFYLLFAVIGIALFRRASKQIDKLENDVRDRWTKS